MSNADDTSEMPRTQRIPRKLNRKAALAQHARGLSTPEIARLQGVNRSTVFRFLQQSEPERQALEHFKTGRADVLARIQAKSLDVQERIIDSLKEDGVLLPLTPHQKTGLVSVLSAQMGTAYDKERLERGHSPANVSLLGRMMSEAFERAGRTTSDPPPDRSSQNDIAPKKP